jgi:hypothetical protein
MFSDSDFVDFTIPEDKGKVPAKNSVPLIKHAPIASTGYKTALPPVPSTSRYEKILPPAKSSSRYETTLPPARIAPIVVDKRTTKASVAYATLKDRAIRELLQVIKRNTERLSPKRRQQSRINKTTQNVGADV